MSQSQGVKVFVRDSTGLVRNVTGSSSFFATFALVTGGVPIFLISLLFLAPGANWYFAYLIMFIPSIALGAVYTLFGISMPRSGGDYVFVSRGLNSVLGFLNSFGLFFAYVFSLGIYSFFAAQYVAYAIYTYGFMYSNTALQNLAAVLLTKNAEVISAVIVIGVFLLMLTFVSTRTAFKLIYVTGILEVIATVILFGLTASIPHSVFVSAFDKYAGPGAYNSVISTAESNGLMYSSAFSSTILAFPIAWYAFTWYTMPANWSGELKQVRKSLPIAIIYALLFILVFYLAFYYTSFAAFGQKFLTAWSYDYANGLSLPFPFIGTYTPFFVSLVYNNPIIPILGVLVFWLPDVLFFVPTMIGASRYLFSWSFDRAVPEVFSKVSMKTKTPFVTTITVGVIGILGVFAYAYIPATAIIDIIPIFDFGFIIPALTAILFPFVKKDLYNNTFVVKRKILGLPIISWLGIIALAGIIYGIVGLWNSYLMPINAITGIFIGAIYITAAIIFIAMYFVNRRHGINITDAYKEIPPE